MELEEILAEWAKDAPIDESELGRQSSQVPVLHHKYYKMYARESLTLKRLEADHVVLRAEKNEFYTLGPTKEQVDRGWKLPPRGKILKSEVRDYLESDQDVIEAGLAIAYQREKVECLRDILKMIHGRSWLIGRALEDMKFKSGAG